MALSARALFACGTAALSALSCGPSESKDNNVIVINNGENNGPSNNGQNNGQNNGANNPLNNANNTSDVTPLGPNELIFIKEVSDDADQIYAFNVTSRTERRISALDDDGGDEIGSVALSPDRKLIAFASYYRLDPATIPDDAFPTEAIHLMSVDGKYLGQLSPPIPGPPTNSCTTDADCIDGYVCFDFGRCSEPRPTASLFGLSWAPDQSAVWFEVSSFQWQQSGVVGGTRIGWATMDGDVDINVGGTACSLVGDPTPRPGGEHVAALHSVCNTESSGLVLYSNPPSGPPMVVLDEADIDFDLNSGSMDWVSDGSAVALTGGGVFYDENNNSIFGDVVIYVDVIAAELRILTDVIVDADLTGVAISPDDKKLVFCDHRVVNEEHLYDLWLIDSEATPPDPVKITGDGKSCYASW